MIPCVGSRATIVSCDSLRYELLLFSCSQDDGFDPEGCIGAISSLYIMSKKYEGEFSTAHRPVVCSFTVSFVDR